MESEQNLIRLYRHLLKDYESDVRPSIRHDLPVNVTFSFSLTQIIDVDERNQIITTNAWIRQNWVDYKLIWDPAEFDNLTFIHIPYERIWRPDVILYNNADAHYKESVMSTDVLVNFQGNVSWSAAGIFKSSCPLDVRYYPFDYQNCVLKFASWAYDGTKIDIILNSEKGDETNFMTSTEWHLNLIRAEKNYIIYSCCPEPYPFVDVHISIQRRPMFYVFNLILPCVLISAIALLGFYMPSDSGEKVTLGITSLLSTTVFLMLVAEGMPPTSEALPLIGIYYGVTIFIVSLATAMTVFTLNVHHHGQHGNPVPPFVQKIAFKFLARLLCLRIEQYHSISNHVHHLYQKEFGKYEEYHDKPKIYDSCATVEQIPLAGVHAKLCNGSPEGSAVKRVSFTSDVNGSALNGSGTGGPDTFESEFLRVLNTVHATIARNEMRLAENDRRDASNLEWQQVALVLDRFLLIVFVFGTACVSLAIIYQRQLCIG
ncbi:Ligand-gated ion channel 4 [Toxocara canis]|uniref:Ligand-gated ion channel 4 n=2 Tax=Toxocara canis TaxID=6265 RepID=A0A0B2V3V2_TOXCA|nr:Ligand-gated ion channel 4 [Toxocara canis]